jgi:hypothetical protein
MVFWALHFAIGLSGLFALGFAWRWGIILLYTLVVELFTFLWMMLPLFSVRYEIVAMVLGGLVVGAVIATGRDPMPPWIGAAGAAARLLVLRGSLIALGLLDGTTSSEAVLKTSPADAGLIVATGAGLLLGSLAMAALKGRGPRTS